MQPREGRREERRREKRGGRARRRKGGREGQEEGGRKDKDVPIVSYKTDCFFPSAFSIWYFRAMEQCHAVVEERGIQQQD